MLKSRVAVFSVKMRASRAEPAGRESHLSGGERVVARQDIRRCVDGLLKRALGHSLGAPDAIRVKIEAVEASKVRFGKALPVTTCRVASLADGERLAQKALEACGLSREAAKFGLSLIRRGPAPGGRNMRGAVLLQARSLRRLEEDHFAGIRATRMDFTPAAESKLSRMLRRRGNYNPRTRDALALATKVCSYPGVVAELCCSDDPDYPGGYVASPALGYFRINRLKPVGHPRGGRIIYIDLPPADVIRYRDYLRDACLRLNDVPSASASLSARDAARWLDSRAQGTIPR